MSNKAPTLISTGNKNKYEDEENFIIPESLIKSIFKILMLMPVVCY
jgi:hypothetical protein